MSENNSGKANKAGSPVPQSPPQAPVRTTNVLSPARDETNAFLQGIPDLTEDQRKLLIELYLANGQDAFDAEAAAVGRLKQEEYLALPRDMKVPTVKAVEVGNGHVGSKFDAKNLSAVYYLNKARAPAGENPIVYAMLRMEAVKMGWVESQKEVIYVPFDKYPEAIREFTTDLAGVRTQLSTFRLAAFLIPLVCEHTFRVTGHHYITGLASDYQARYRKTLKACLSEEIMGLLQPATLFHHVLHWVSPARTYNVLEAQLETRTIPDAMIIRATAAPAGYAIITTTAAVLDAMSSANLDEKVEESFDGDLDDVRNASKKIRQNVRKWHKAHYAYNVAPPSAAEIEAMGISKDTAIAFAPYAQGFIEGTLKDAALGQAQALKKHAELNPVARARATRFFRQLTRTEVTEVADLFKTSLVAANKDDD